MPSKNYPFTKSTTIITLAMVVSAIFTRQLLELVTAAIGKAGVKILLGFILIGTAAVFFIIEAKRLASWLRTVIMIIIIAMALFYAWRIKLEAVRMHILMYAIVGWLASRDAMKSAQSWKIITVAWLFAASAGILEELLQKILPYRVFEINDILFNIKGATLGVIFYSLKIK